MVSDLVERNRTEEPDAGVPHVRICGEGAGQPVPLPGGFDTSDFNVLRSIFVSIILRYLLPLHQRAPLASATLIHVASSSLFISAGL
jgi:hypothetical protein